MKVFLEIADRLEAGILRGDYLPGSRLSMRSFAKKIEVSEGTFQNALRYLKDKRLVTVKRAQGYFVIEDKAYTRQMRQRKGDELVQSLFSSLYSLGMTNREISELIEEKRNSLEIV